MRVFGGNCKSGYRNLISGTRTYESSKPRTTGGAQLDRKVPQLSPTKAPWLHGCLLQCSHGGTCRQNEICLRTMAAPTSMRQPAWALSECFIPWDKKKAGRGTHLGSKQPEAICAIHTLISTRRGCIIIFKRRASGLCEI